MRIFSFELDKKWNTNLVIFYSLIVLVACGKSTESGKINDSSWSSLYQNGSGAVVVDLERAHEASLYAAASGVDVDILELERNVHAYGGVTVEATVLFSDGTKFPVYTTHYNPSVVHLQQVHGELLLDMLAQCSDAQCSRYIFILEIRSNSELIIQQALRYDFLYPQNSRYQWFAPQHWMNFTSLVQYLGGY